MRSETFISIASDEVPWTYKGYRCIECGEIIDPIILLNRKRNLDHQKEPVGQGLGKK